MFCRNCGAVLPDGAYVCTQCGVPSGSGNQFCFNCGNRTDPLAVVCTQCGAGLNAASVNPNQKSSLVAGLLAIFVGALGVHNFYLGYTSKAVAQLLLTLLGGWLCGLGAIAAAIWAIVEGVQLLTGSINVDANGMPLKKDF